VNYEYTAYGLSLRSDVQLPGLAEAIPAADSRPVILATKSQPTWVDEAANLPSEVIYFLPAAPECADPAFVVREFGGGICFQLSYSDGTEFFVDTGGESVWGHCPVPLTVEDLATYFLGPVMGFVLRRRGVTPLHASAVRIGAAAAILSGAATAGKSTTAAALALRGSPVLCEDIAALDESNGRFFVRSGYPRVCLWPDSAEKLLGSTDALPNLTPNWEKKFLALEGTRASFESRTMPLGAIYLLQDRSGEDTAPRLEEISSREALLELVQNTYMNALLSKGQRAAEFELLGRLVNQVPCKRLIPHRDAERISALCELIEKDAREVFATGVPTSAGTRHS
jgi:hypothetical protein